MTVFLSYARLDNIVVDPVVAGLDRHDVRYWFDRRDIPVSFPWKTEIGHAIRSSVIVVVLGSDAWHASTHCRSELAVAVTLDKAVIHIDVRDTGADEIVAIIERALSALTPIQRAHTELFARSGSWHRNERAESGLVGGRLLQQLLRVVADDPPLPSEARDFLASSELRDARRRRLRKVGVVVTLAAFGVISLMQAVDQRGEEKLRGQATILAAPAYAHYETEGNPYAGLRSAADESLVDLAVPRRHHDHRDNGSRARGGRPRPPRLARTRRRGEGWIALLVAASQAVVVPGLPDEDGAGSDEVPGKLGSISRALQRPTQLALMAGRGKLRAETAKDDVVVNRRSGGRELRQRVSIRSNRGQRSCVKLHFSYTASTCLKYLFECGQS